MDLRTKADEYLRRAARLRTIAKGFQAAGAHNALLQAADTWDQLARAALRDLEWQRSAAIGARIAVEPNSDNDESGISTKSGEDNLEDLHDASQQRDPQGPASNATADERRRA